MRRVRRAAAPALGVLLAGGLFVQAGQLDAFGVPDQLGPGSWPRLVLAGLAVACLLKAVLEARRPIALREEPAADPALAPGRLAAAILLILLYPLALPTLGFPLATAGFIAGFMRLGGRRWGGALLAAPLGTVVSLYLFVKLVYLPLPKGDGPFEALTLALYRALRIF